MGNKEDFYSKSQLERNMLQKLIKFSIENKLTIGKLTVALII